MRLKDKVAIITGSGRGLGREAAVLFAQEGARVVVCDINEQAAADAAKDISDAGGAVMWARVDVTDPDSVRAMVDGAMERFGRIDILVNNAGITADAMLVKMTDDQWDQSSTSTSKAYSTALARWRR